MLILFYAVDKRDRKRALFQVEKLDVMHPRMKTNANFQMVNKTSQISPHKVLGGGEGGLKVRGVAY